MSHVSDYSPQEIGFLCNDRTGEILWAYDYEHPDRISQYANWHVSSVSQSSDGLILWIY